jgi:2-phospho-L-lactate guanylyltransferase
LIDIAVGVPIKPFGAAKRRLSGVLGLEQRRELARYLAATTMSALAEAGCDPIVLSANEEVGQFAREHGHRAYVTPELDLNQACERFRQVGARGRAWLLVHADLPYISAKALSLPTRLISDGAAVIVPSPDGGTPVLGGSDDRLAFSYGPGSFHRHLRQMPSARILIQPTLACDIDRPHDLEVALSRSHQLSSLLGS